MLSLITLFTGAVIGFFTASLLTAASRADHSSTLPAPPPPGPPEPIRAAVEIYNFAQLQPPDSVTWTLGPITVIEEEPGVLQIIHNEYNEVVWLVKPNDLKVDNIQKRIFALPCP